MTDHAKLKTEIAKVVDCMIEIDACRDTINETLKSLKKEFGIDATQLRRVATTIKNSNRVDEENKHDEFIEILDIVQQKEA
jgi:ABC-type microcin C transport system permease subunit YejB